MGTIISYCLSTQKDYQIWIVCQILNLYFCGLLMGCYFVFIYLVYEKEAAAASKIKAEVDQYVLFKT